MLFDFLRELGNQFSKLYNTHTAGVLKEVVPFKSGEILLILSQIVRNPLAA